MNLSGDDDGEEEMLEEGYEGASYCIEVLDNESNRSSLLNITENFFLFFFTEHSEDIEKSVVFAAVVSSTSEGNSSKLY